MKKKANQKAKVGAEQAERFIARGNELTNLTNFMQHANILAAAYHKPTCNEDCSHCPAGNLCRKISRRYDMGECVSVFLSILATGKGHLSKKSFGKPKLMRGAVAGGLFTVTYALNDVPYQWLVSSVNPSSSLAHTVAKVKRYISEKLSEGCFVCGKSKASDLFVERKFGKGFRIVCKECGMATPFRKTLLEAAVAWEKVNDTLGDSNKFCSYVQEHFPL